MAEAFVISGEADLWSILEAAQSGAKDLPSADVFKIIGWTPRLLYFPDEPIGHSISPTTARAITGFHASLARSYAYTVYGKPDARRLRADDSAALDLQMLVISGSNGIEIIGNALDRLTDAIVHKLTGKQMGYLIAIFLLLNFSETVAKNWIAEMYAEKAHEADDGEHIRLSELETQRMQIMAKALQATPAMKPVAEIATEGRTALARSIVPSGGGDLLGTFITSAQASTIVSKERDQGASQRLDGRFEVVEIDIENPEGYMGTLRDVKTHQEIKVSINRGELPDSDIQTLFSALRDKALVDAMVNAWIVSGKISYASVVRADPPKP